MSVDNISVSLRAWHPAGKRLPAAQFLEKLVIHPTDGVKKSKGPGNPRITMLSLAFDDFIQTHEPSEAFAAAVHEGLQKAANWLRKQSPEIFASLRTAGFITDVHIGAWIDSDQIDLDLPPDFLLACGQHGLTVSLVTND